MTNSVVGYILDMAGAEADYERAQMAQEADTVADCFACPVCHNNEMDTLEWNRDGTEVTCTKCNTTYDPNA